MLPFALFFYISNGEADIGVLEWRQGQDERMMCFFTLSHFSSAGLASRWTQRDYIHLCLLARVCCKVLCEVSELIEGLMKQKKCESACLELDFKTLFGIFIFESQFRRSGCHLTLNVKSLGLFYNKRLHSGAIVTPNLVEMRLILSF